MTALIDLAIRSSIVVLAALIASSLLRGRSAALRHLVLAAGLLCAAAVLPMKLALPSWDIPIPSTTSQASVGEVSTTMAGATTLTVDTAAAPTRRITTLQVAAIVWALGFAACAATLLAGFCALAWTASRATRVTDERWMRLIDRVSGRYGLRRPVTLLHADESALLATWGLFRTRVLLPTHALAWSDERAHVVLCHELAHIRRRDWLVQVSAEVLRAVYWFNPLVWIACARLRRESEQACDDEVLVGGVPAREYATHLLDVARSCRTSPIRLSAALSIAHPSTLERRIAAMLDPRLNRDALTRRAVVATAVALLALTLPTAALRAAARQAPQPLAGSVYDATGAVMPDVALTLEDARQVKLETTSDASGRFEFAPVGPGHYVLTASLAGFRPLRHEFDLRQARDWEQAITLQVGTVQETVTVTARRVAESAVPATPSGRLRVGGSIRPPRKLVHVGPVYPPNMRDAGLEGVVPLEATIGRDGSVTSVRIVSAQVHPAFAKSAVEAVRQWKFEPTLLNGEPVEVVMTVSVRFNLED